MTQLVTYLGDATLKSAFLEQITLHEQQDALIKGTYGQMNSHFRGCAIGCSLHSLNVLQGRAAPERDTDAHGRYEAELGLPTWLAYLEDNIFESLPDALSQTWPRRFADAVPVGATVNDRVLARLLHWCVADAEFGVRYITDDDTVRGYIDVIATALDAEANGTATADQLEAAARAAWAVWAAMAVRDAMAARAVKDAWVSWEAWAARAARVAWVAWVSWVAWAVSQPSAALKFYPALSEYVLTVLRELPTETPT